MSAEMSAVCWNMKGEWKVRTLKTIFFFSPFSPALRMRSAAVSSCVFGASAVKMQQKERLAALVSTRLTAAPTSAVLSIKVQYSAQSSEGCLMNLYVLLENGSVWGYCFACVCSALLFPVCSAKPIERERCFGAPNHLMELLSWDIQDEGPRKHCPCAGDLHCQHLGWVRCILLHWMSYVLYLMPSDWFCSNKPKI